VPVRLRIERGPHRGVVRAEIARRARAIFRALHLGESELSIVLTDDDQIRLLNKNYRHKDRPTDVLAFAMREGQFGRISQGLLGDVIVSVPTARAQAGRRKKDLVSELTMLIAHGTLHLLGWDHDTTAKDKRMRAETERLCEEAARSHGTRTERGRRAPRRRQSIDARKA
jgi:probable rRNA maturation factor